MNLAAGDERASSFRFLADAGEDGMLRRVFVASPKIRFCGTLEVAMVKMWQLELRSVSGGKRLPNSQTLTVFLEELTPRLGFSCTRRDESLIAQGLWSRED